MILCPFVEHKNPTRYTSLRFDGPFPSQVILKNVKCPNLYLFRRNTSVFGRRLVHCDAYTHVHFYIIPTWAHSSPAYSRSFVENLFSTTEQRSLQPEVVGASIIGRLLHPLSSNLNLRPVCDQSSDLFSCDRLRRAFEASLRHFSLVQGTYPPPACTHGHMTCKGMGFLCGFLCKQSNTTGSGLYILLITELTLLFYCSGMHCQIQTECLNAKKYSCVTLK